MIEKRGGTAYRLGFGAIHIDAFFEAQLKREHIMLG
jgi:hypothetical protein